MQRIDFQLLLLRSTRQTLFCSINAREVELPIDICDFVTVQKKKAGFRIHGTVKKYM